MSAPGFGHGLAHTELTGADFLHNGGLGSGGKAIDGDFLFDYDEGALGVDVEVAMLAVEDGFDFVLSYSLFDFLADVLDFGALEGVLDGLLDRGRQIFHLEASGGGEAGEGQKEGERSDHAISPGSICPGSRIGGGPENSM